MAGRIVTVPNGVTLARLACIPVFVALIAGPRSDWFPAACLLVVLGSTDWVDGQLARRLGQVSTVGKVLDPLADRLLLGTAALSIVVVGAVPLWVAVIALAKEVTVAVGFLVVAGLGGRRMDVSLVGKASTFGLMTALPLFLAGHSTVGFRGPLEVAAWVAVVPALIFGWAAVIGYVGPARRELAAGRAARSAEHPTP